MLLPTFFFFAQSFKTETKIHSLVFEFHEQTLYRTKMLSKQLCAQAGERSNQGHTVGQKEAVVLQLLVHGGRVLFTSALWANQARLLECLLA